MTYLIIGYLNDKALSFLSVYARKFIDKFICLDNKDKDTNILDVFENCIFLNKEININTIDLITNTYTIDRILNFYELSEEGHTLAEYNKENYEFVVQLYKLCLKKKIQHMIHLSTSLLYRETLANLRTEEEKSYPTSNYTQSKLNADLYLLNRKKVAVIRVCEIYGMTYDNNYFNNMIKNILDNKEVYLPKDYNYLRGYLNHVDFASLLSRLSLKKSYGLYNISSDFFAPIIGMFSASCKKLNYNKEAIFIEDNSLKYKSVRMDGELIQSEVLFKLEQEKEKFIFYLESL